MSEPLLISTAGQPESLLSGLHHALDSGQTVALAIPEELGTLSDLLAASKTSFIGPAIVLGTGGSTGARRWCLQPLVHLNTAVQGAAHWLQSLQLDPARLEIFNPLPLHHVSGLMPVLRARAWGAELRWLTRAWMRDPLQLLRHATPRDPHQAVLSLVPTQLQRLLAVPDGVRWLQRFALIWIGGDSLAPPVAQRCRTLGLRLSPCYGSTETGAMVMALSPDRFLSGVEGCGFALPHAQLRADSATGALQIKSHSLAAGLLQAGGLEPLPLDQGWWSSGDRAAFGVSGWQLLGRLDGAIHSGGETVFPDQVAQHLLELARLKDLCVGELLLLPQRDPLWGHRLVALVQPLTTNGHQAPSLLRALQDLAMQLPACQRPRRWLLCPTLRRNALGKWDRALWIQWVDAQLASEA